MGDAYIPVLTQKCIPLIPPVQAGAAVAELPKSDLRPDIQRDDVENVALGTVCDACSSRISISQPASQIDRHTLYLLIIPRPLLPDQPVEQACCFLDLRPGLLAVLHEQAGIEGDCAGDFVPGLLAMRVADLGSQLECV